MSNTRSDQLAMTTDTGAVHAVRPWSDSCDQMAMTTSMTRSRRAEGLHASHPKIPNTHRYITNAKPAAAAAAAGQNTQQQHPFQVSGSLTNPPARANKRQLDAEARDRDPIVQKRPRFSTGIAVEIPARSSVQSRIAKESADATKSSQPASPAKSTAVASPHHAPPKSGQEPPQPHAPPPPAPARAPQQSRSVAPTKSKQQQQQQQQPTLTKHQEKVVNGLKHELNRLHPNVADTKEQNGGRKLRSQEATRFKSELSAYFPDYDEVIGNDPKEEHILNIDTPIVITSDAATASPEGGRHPPLPHITTNTTYPVRSYADVLFTDLFDSQRIDFQFLMKSKPLDHDPLPDSVYELPHKKAERVERSIRNTEKGRAQHEKDQIIRLLDGLQGHDWLRVMGVSGITETRKKQFEPAREHFIKGCQNILDKFRRWTAEEKRRKQEKERAAAEAEKRAERESATSEDQDDDADSEDSDDEIPDSDEEMDGEEDDDDDDEEDEDPPDGDSDVDASIAKQLRVEALAAAAKKKRQQAVAARRGKRKPPPPPTIRGRTVLRRSRSVGTRSESVSLPRLAPPPAPPPPPKEITSFFEKRYQRDAALNPNRRRGGRTVLAWGRPVPEVEEREFELPEGILDEDMLKSRARRRRRDRRGK
ncbi:something about silencing, SAS, complex subunit 4-domain-containing protein [Cladorrhinum samala]|uniref:Something about silencing, SAS, complex subunit 4-domain-containing protein n=1 Tax=Cladorrhinum samala TaxID=585594 RepID=A0AAV9HTD5_9PEZI|nr:something about silencing, SAS, complex subunit 4-domain-containing protein [Cladorrhinum samala]